MGSNKTEERLISYILGELSEAEQLQLEEELYSQADSFEQLQSIKEFLMDEYARNRLSSQQRKLFEEKFLNSPWRRERV